MVDGIVEEVGGVGEGLLLRFMVEAVGSVGGKICASISSKASDSSSLSSNGRIGGRVGALIVDGALAEAVVAGRDGGAAAVSFDDDDMLTGTALMGRGGLKAGLANAAFGGMFATDFDTPIIANVYEALLKWG